MRYLLALALLGCHEPGIVVGSLDEALSLKAAPNRDLDLLFVIDNSASMLDEQAALAAAFPLMIDRLSQLDGGLPNLHIGVTTSDMGTSAASSLPGPAIGTCAGTGRNGEIVFLSDVGLADGRRVRNFGGELRDAFASAANVGGDGCGFEQHLSAMSHAFDNPANAGFLRDKANLAVVIIADEDDCSLENAALLGPPSAELGSQQSFRCFRFGAVCDQDANQVGLKTNCVADEASAYITPVSGYIDRLVALKGDEREVMVAVVTGDPSPVAVELRAPPGSSQVEPALAPACDQPGVVFADPAVRLAAFVDGFPGRGTRTSLCSGDIPAAIDQIGASAKAMMGDPCLDTSRLDDSDTTTPGVQPACDVVDIRDSAPLAPTSLQPCAAGTGDCYEILADATACPSTEDHLRVRFHRASEAAEDAWTYIRCKSAE